MTRRPASLLLALALTGAACSKTPDTAAGNAAPLAQAIGPQNIAVARNDTLRSGPAISGTLAADREARIRAEIAGAVLQTFAEQGERVSAGMVLARIDDANVRDAELSARSAVAQATVAAGQAARELQRATTLAAAGAIAERDVEGAERASLGAQAQLADAKARLSSAEKNLRNTMVRAPFAGVVSERAVSPGDIVAPGAALFTVIDPRSLRVEAAVPTSALADVRVGAPVLFTVNGSDRVLEGRVTRVSPMVDPQTKQVRLLASVPNQAGALVAGLFVEGRVASEKRVGVMIPENAVDQTGIVSIVMRLKGGKVEKVEVQLGVRDEAASMFEITSGIASGDTVLMGAARGISVGSPVVVSAPRDATPAPAAAPAKQN
ncbi:MAG: efflux RND transporter periplasmic adaptor subunit [Gemmatimonadota bacterium]|nr:efflux RND transporter periplasmic adaptor subunit [Gemmatimonadota bacterium]MDQ8167499.1 efflux RND transporter periplasmic adaptor subunit [Gemmatimonadota bacterium]